MKILLIDPPFYRFIGYYNRYFPLGLAYIAAVLQDDGHDVLLYDADYNANPSKMDFTRLEDSYPLYLKSLKDAIHPIWQEFKEAINKFQPDVVGITVWTTFAASSFNLASICKQYDKNLPVVMGGPHISIKYEEVLKICPDVDFLVRGEGEETFLELSKAIDKGWKKRNGDFQNIKGISYRKEGKIIHNSPREFIKDLDSIPFPARELLLNKNSYNSEDMGLLMTSRGCPYDCSYCATSIWQRKIRYRSIDNSIEEIKLIINKYGTNQFTFKDDSFTINKKRVLEFCERLIKENIEINWDCNTRVNLVDEELLKKMKKAGCNSIKVGIETGSEHILKLMNKNITFEQCRMAAKLFRKVGIHWTAYFMMGVPGETVDDIYKTLDFMYEVKPDFASIGVYEPFPGTSMFDEGVRRGIVKKEMTLEDFYTTLPNHYYIADARHQVDTVDEARFAILEREIKKKFHNYNKSYRQVLKRVKSRANIYIKEPSMFIGDIKKYLHWRSAVSGKESA